MSTPNVSLKRLPIKKLPTKRLSTQCSIQLQNVRAQHRFRKVLLCPIGLLVAIASTLSLTQLSAAQATSDGFILSPPRYISQSEDVYFLASDYDLNRAKNLARQRGEAENGGVSVYETEPSMHGPAAGSPHVINADGSVTFIFRGGPRGGGFYTIETQVTVTYDDQTQWSIVTDYNKEIPPTTVPMSDLL